MCGDGNQCNICTREAVMEVYWDCWQGSYCVIHGLIRLVFSKEPISIFYAKTGRTWKHVLGGVPFSTD